jgi:hypothetical protein
VHFIVACSDVHKRRYMPETFNLSADTLCRFACEIFLMYAINEIFKSLSGRGR